MNWKNKLFYTFLFVVGIIIVIYTALIITTCIENQRINSEAATYKEPQVIKEPEATEQEKAQYEEQTRKQQAEIEAQQQALQQAQAENIKEQKWQEAQQQVPPLTKSGGIGYSDGYKLTYYSSNVLYHCNTGEWRLDNNGFYRAWDGKQWCFVISMNISYGYMGQTIPFSFGPCIVLDSGCIVGVVDMYCNW